MKNVNKDEIIKFIDSLKIDEVNKILFSRLKTLDSIKEIWRESLKDKLLKESKKQFEYISETLTNLWTQRFENGISILFKPFDATGYDGAFLIKENDLFHIFLSETKSSERKSWDGDDNFISKKISEARGDLDRKFRLINKKGASSSREEDNENIGNKVDVLLLRGPLSGISQENKNILTQEIVDIANGLKYTCAISAVMSKNDEVDESKLKTFGNVTYKNIPLAIETIDDFDEIKNCFVKKLGEFYE